VKAEADGNGRNDARRDVCEVAEDDVHVVQVILVAWFAVVFIMVMMRMLDCVSRC